MPLTHEVSMTTINYTTNVAAADQTYRFRNTDVMLQSLYYCLYFLRLSLVLLLFPSVLLCYL